MAARRDAAAKRLSDLTAPDTHDEHWKYSPAIGHDLELLASAPAASAAVADASVELPTALVAVLDATGPRAGLVVVMNGRVVRAEVDAELAARGLALGGVADVESADAIVGSIALDADWLGSAHTSRLIDAAVIDVPRGMVLAAPLVVVQWISEAGAVVAPHVTLRAGEQSEFTLLEFRASADVEAHAATTVELDIGPAANVTYVGVQDLGREVWEAATVWSRTHRDATLHSQLISLGGRYARVDLQAFLPGTGSTTEIAAIYFGDGDQVHDFRSTQDHTSIKGTSHFLLKGAAADESRGIYNGVIRIHQGAKGTDAFLTNRNLVLSDGAGIDSIPNLEIVNENDLRNCGHAAATGPVDEEHVFYLESRGVPTDVAQKLIVFGFFEEVVAALAVPGLRDLLRQAIARKVAAIR